MNYDDILKEMIVYFVFKKFLKKKGLEKEFYNYIKKSITELGDFMKRIE